MSMKKNIVLWIMGPTSSGKTTLAEALVDRLRGQQIPTIHYDGDEVRDFLGCDHGFTSKDRLRVVKILVHLANKASAAGLNVIVSALTANPDARDYVNNNLKQAHIVYVKCSIEICASRDPKGLYKKAMNGEIVTLVGFNSKYHPPENYSLSLDTERCSLDENIKLLENYFIQALSVCTDEL